MSPRISESGRNRQCRRKVRRVIRYVEPGNTWRGRDISARFARCIPEIGHVIPRSCTREMADSLAAAGGPTAGSAVNGCGAALRRRRLGLPTRRVETSPERPDPP